MEIKPLSGSPLFTTWQRLLFDLLLMIIGGAISALAINSILIPQRFATGGITGLTLVIHRLFPVINTGWIYLLLNIPLFGLAWMVIGRRFFVYSIFGALTLSSALTMIHYPINLDDKILSALLAGIMVGTGTGLALRSFGSQGGMDILSVLLLKRYSINLGTTVLVTNIFVLILIGLFYSLDAVLYTLIVLFVSSKMVGIVVTGISKRKAVFIISSKWEEISREILKDIHRGVTILEGRGGYKQSREHILYTVVTLMEIGRMKAIINDLDPNAFVVISDTMEVINYRIGNQPHW
ncbi:MAG: YitT family protein [Proteobacteria bacterium]|nr:YitT family protein [Pseudomonadota bacterium]MBU1686191.1 YitT family protein [Pseudomonadota bacterium]